MSDDERVSAIVEAIETQLDTTVLSLRADTVHAMAERIHDALFGTALCAISDAAADRWRARRELHR